MEEYFLLWSRIFPEYQTSTRSALLPETARFQELLTFMSHSLTLVCKTQEEYDVRRGQRRGQEYLLLAVVCSSLCCYRRVLNLQPGVSFVSVGSNSGQWRSNDTDDQSLLTAADRKKTNWIEFPSLLKSVLPSSLSSEFLNGTTAISQPVLFYRTTATFSVRGGDFNCSWLNKWNLNDFLTVLFQSSTRISESDCSCLFFSSFKHLLH